MLDGNEDKFGNDRASLLPSFGPPVHDVVLNKLQELAHVKAVSGIHVYGSTVLDVTWTRVQIRDDTASLVADIHMAVDEQIRPDDRSVITGYQKTLFGLKRDGIGLDDR